MSVELLFILVISAVNAKDQSLTLFPSVSEGCRAAVQRLSTLQATEPQLMAHYWDSWGKPSDSILTGHTTFLGYYDECINLKNTDLGDMKYCIYPMIMDTNVMQRPSESEDGVCHSSNCPIPVNTSTVLNVKVGVCYPSVCSANEFAVVLSKMNIKIVTTTTSDPFSDTTNTITIDLNITEDSPPFCPVTDEVTDEEYDAGTIAVIATCAVLVGLVVVATIIDTILWVPSTNVTVISKADNKLAMNSKDVSKENLSEPLKTTISNSPTLKDFILAFSLYTTGSNFSMKQSPSALKALGGIKILFNLMIITFHVQQFIVLFYSATSQNSYLQHLTSTLSFQPITNVTFSVETFFVVSGTLSAYLTFKDMEKHERFRFKYFYLNRYFRLSPLLYLYTLIAYKPV